MNDITQFRGQYFFLSNFFPVFVKYEGVKYPSVEHAYQAAKTLDQDWRERVCVAATAASAKGLGRKAPIRQDWDRIRLDIMFDLVWQKFQAPHLRDQLLATAPVNLVERNHWGDTFWGVCKQKGENHLGKILMAVRDDIARQ